MPSPLSRIPEWRISTIPSSTSTASTPGFDGWRELPEGEIVSFLIGEAGAHQIVNRTDTPVRLLAFSTSGAPDIVIRPDSGTLGVFERRPEGGGLYSHFRAEDAVDYFDGEQPPEPAYPMRVRSRIGDLSLAQWLAQSAPNRAENGRY